MSLQQDAIKEIHRHVYGWFADSDGQGKRATPISRIKRPRQGNADALPEAKRPCYDSVRDSSYDMCLSLFSHAFQHNVLGITHGSVQDSFQNTVASLDLILNTDSNNACWKAIGPLDRVVNFKLVVIYNRCRYGFGIRYRRDGPPEYDIGGDYNEECGYRDVYARMDRRMKAWAAQNQGTLSRVWLRDLFLELYAFKSELDAL